MKNHLLSFLAVLSSFTSLFAQLPDDYRSEQIYLSPLRASVMPGDSIDVEGVVTSLAGDNVRPYSRYLYVELIGEADSALIRSKVACESLGDFSLRVPTDPLDAKGIYWLRAYTSLMRNFNPASFALQPVALGTTLPADDGIIDSNASLSLFPAGGMLSPGRPQNVVAYLSSGQGFPLGNKKLTLTDAAGKVIADAVTSPSGLATLSFLPATGQTYTVTFSDNGVVKKQSLTASDGTTPKVEGSITGNRIAFHLEGVPRGGRLMIYDRANGLSEAALTDATGSMTLPVPPETATLFLTDADGTVLAATSVAATTAAAPLSFSVPSSIAGGSPLEISGLPNDSMSIVLTRILAADDLMSGHAESAIKYLSDFASPIPFPQRYFTSDARTRAEDLAAWISTASFKRFSPGTVLHESPNQVYAYLPERVMEITGQVFRSPENPFRGGRIVAYNASTDCVYDTVIGPDGRFTIAVDNFPQGTEFFLQPINDKGQPSRSEVKIDDTTFPAAIIDRTDLPVDSRYLAADVSIGKGSSLDPHLLADVVVKAVVKSEPKSTEQFYATRYKDREDIETKGYQSLRDIIRDMPFLRMERRNNGWVLATSRSAYSLSRGGTLIPVLIDGTLFEPDEYASMIDMPATEIESVEHLTPTQAIAYTSRSINGVLNIKTRNRGTSHPAPLKGTIVTPMGLDTDTVTDAAVIAPTIPGRYRVAVDVVDASGNIRSAEKWIDVK